ncbi:hypothetical protein MAR_020350 [Mya arenaria]|uniref:NACHT domain-containing protein n=1 Tax=Mya arenaria TaxID=6604 RepID=A0ABY7E8R2_MYAAR|nr:uncharacterized protein LOC128235294 [Mya arenaria]WAR04981.1 hypothetical protein MAR_020350 [Mya arenaria]
MATCAEIIEDEETQNCIKCLYGMKITRNGLIRFTNDVMTAFRDQAVDDANENNSAKHQSCSSCTTKSVVPCPTRGICSFLRGTRACKFHDSLPQPCPNKLCNHMLLFIMRNHKYGAPSLKNTDASAWFTNAWEIAKCFCPPDGYINAKSAKETDLNGLLSIFENCVLFEDKFNDVKCIGEIREYCRNLRHSPNMQIPNTEVPRIFQVLRNLLSDQKDIGTRQEAKQALEQLNELESNNITISMEETKIILATERQAAEECQHKQCQDTQGELINQIASRLDQITMLLELIEQRSRRQSTRETATNDGETTDTVKMKYDEKVKGFAEDLCILYNKYYSTLPLGPLFEEKVTPVEDMFVIPTLTHLKTETTSEKKREDMFRSGCNTFQEPITSIDEIFMRKNKRATTIYLEGKTGFGKTSYCTFLTTLWCRKNSKVNERRQGALFTENSAYIDKSKILEEFKLLFLVPLRSVEAGIVDVDDMIYKHIIPNLAHKDTYDMAFLREVLNEERCLIVLDGLDEWLHPSRHTSCMQKHCCLPHCSFRNCVLLISSKPGKIADSCVAFTEFENRLALQKLDERARRILVENISKRLKKDTCGINVVKFLAEVEKDGIQDFLSNPLTIVQIMCLWHDDKSFVDSRCKVYCQILNMLLIRAEQKSAPLHISQSSDEKENVELPPCFTDDAECCHKYKTLLLKLGELAFKSLKSDNAHMLDARTVTKTLSSEEEKFTLCTGILSKHEQSEKFARKVCYYNFLHSTYQEMLCCLYLVCAQRSDDLTKELLNKLEGKMQKDILSEFFVFSCGMSAKIANSAHEKILKMKHDQMKTCDRIKYLDVRNFRDLTLKGYQESKNDGVEINISLRQCVFDKHMDSQSNPELWNKMEGIYSLACIWHKQFSIKVDEMNKAIQESRDSLLYVFINGEHGKDIRCTSANLNACYILHTLELRSIELTDILDLSNCQTLSSLTIAKVKLSQIHLNPSKLHYCFLRPIDDKDNSFKLSFAENKTFSANLKELTLMKVNVIGELDISKCQHLDGICLWNVSMDSLKISEHPIKTCFLGDHIGNDDKSYWPDVLSILENSTTIVELYVSGSEYKSTELLRTIQTMSNLRDLQLMHIDCSESELNFPKRLERFSLDEVKLSFDAFKVLVSTVKSFQQSIECQFEGCEITNTDSNAIEIFITETCKPPSYEIDHKVFRSRNESFPIPINIRSPGPKVDPNIKNLGFHTCVE